MLNADTLSHLLASSCSAWRGTQVRGLGPRPRQLLHLYEREACPRCRLVRETLTELDLDVVIYPCPKGGKRFRSQLMALGGKDDLPFLVDPNSGRALYSVAGIIGYLHKTYGNTQVTRSWLALRQLGSFSASVLRMGKGRYAHPSRRPERLLELYSFESSPEARLVRERLAELELPYVVRNAGFVRWADYLLPEIRERLLPHYLPQGRNREQLLRLTGQISLPYLKDVNQGVGLSGSVSILRFLEKTYAV